MNTSDQISATQAAGHEVWCAGPSSEESVRVLEATLGVVLPPSYRQFLLNTGALAIYDSTISGVIDDNPTDTPSGSLYGETCRYREDHNLPEHLLVIQPDEEAPYCLDSSAVGKNGEFPVVCFELASRHSGVVAPSFSEWLEKFFFQWAS
ncbi:SMI1/KNR4 family protein [Iodobacter fluviatilis]|uniref:SMI1 / KNR4 family n=1 Tax=Iodobacter fluviatilis TaxID=537 RepID=A0A377Q7N4_9NEIS|nr:SMI1/KNR4 family protein [Iodobacter fluviatilis]TCU89467.1 SUKH superfamily protein [Iodobacter fluviatilis]STQ90837.1 SMI1 / KNR4 family [Iodobacter fluviatilis]